MASAGVIGLGRIGGGVAQSLSRAGFELSVCDVRQEATAPFGDAARTISDLAAASDVIVVAVIDDDQVRTVLTGPGGVFASAKPGSMVVIVSTVLISTIKDMAAAGAEAGIDVVDAGVTGGFGAANRGTLVTMVGGSDDVVGRVRPTLEGFSSLVVHVGPLGSGMKAKLARNLVVYGGWLVNYQAQKLAEAAGVELDKLREIIAASEREIGPGGPPFLSRATVSPMDYDEETLKMRKATAGLAHKDLTAIGDLADQLGLDLPIVKLTDSYVDAIIGMSKEPS